MSTLAFAALTNRRDMSPRGESTKEEGSPGLKTFVDSLAALVPAEVLVAHAAILTFTTTSSTDQAGNPITTISDRGVLRGGFWALVAISMLLYLFGRLGKVGGAHGKWDTWDYLRIAIPPLAFVGWTMIQTNTAFDALDTGLSLAARYLIALLGAIVLGVAAVALAYQADAK